MFLWYTELSEINFWHLTVSKQKLFLQEPELFETLLNSALNLPKRADTP